MYLHNDKQLFEEVVSATANEIGLPIAIIEKDYYVTMILKELSKRAPECVFKGGTSLSKCHLDVFAKNSLTHPTIRGMLVCGLDV